MGASDKIIRLRCFCNKGLGLLLTATLLLCPALTRAQQLPQFSQYVFNSLHINPAYAGYKVDPFVQASYRSQFVSFPGSPETFSLSGDMASKDGSMGFGASILSDRLGASAIQRVLLTYAYRIKTGDRSFLGLGVSAGPSEHSVDGNRLHPDDPTDATIPMERVNLFIPNINSGLFFHSETLFAGLSVFNMVGRQRLENQDIVLAAHNLHYFFQLGGVFDLGVETTFKPSILIRDDFSGPLSYDINAMFLLNNRFWVGTSYRSSIRNEGNRKALVVLLDLFVTDYIRFGYAHDFNLTATNNYRNNSHELSIGYYLGDRVLKGRQNYKF
jgi:type IX secretion system PorP/SprF family membrane protein